MAIYAGPLAKWWASVASPDEIRETNAILAAVDLGTPRDSVTALALVGMIMQRVGDATSGFMHGLVLAFEHPEYARALYQAMLTDPDYNRELTDGTRANLEILLTLVPLEVSLATRPEEGDYPPVEAPYG